MTKATTRTANDAYIAQMRDKDWITFTLYAAGIVGALIWLAIFT